MMTRASLCLARRQRALGESQLVGGATSCGAYGSGPPTITVSCRLIAFSSTAVGLPWDIDMDAARNAESVSTRN